MNLNNYLNERQIEAGLSLSDSEDFVYLKHGEDVIITFGKNVTMKEIHDQADLFLSGIRIEAIK